MNAVAVMGGSRSSSWRRAFADALIRMRPDLNPDAADELSDSAYVGLADLDPGSAAALYCQGGHGQAARSSEAMRQQQMR